MALHPSAVDKEHHAADKNHCAHYWGKRHVMFLIAAGVNRPDINHRFPRRVSKSAPNQADQTKHQSG